MERDFKKHLEELYREMREKNLKPEQMERYKKEFHHAEILLGARGNDFITMKVEPKRKNGPDQTPPRKQPSR